MLTKQGKHANVQVAVAGYLGDRDRKYLEDLKARVQEWGLADRIRFLGEVDRSGKQKFLNSIDILSVPTIYEEPKGLYALEALAHGVPIVQPRHGSFPEMIEATGGGLLVEPHSAAALSDGLTTLLEDPEKRLRLGKEGQEAVQQKLSAEKMAQLTAELFEAILVEKEPREEKSPE